MGGGTLVAYFSRVSLGVRSLATAAARVSVLAVRPFPVRDPRFPRQLAVLDGRLVLDDLLAAGLVRSPSPLVLRPLVSSLCLPVPPISGGNS